MIRSFSATTSSSSSAVEVLDLAPRADPGREAGLVADRVADPGDDPLVEQRVADLAAGPEAPQALAAPRRVEPGRSGSGPSRRRPGSLRSRDSLTRRRILPPVCDAIARPDARRSHGRPYGQATVGGDAPAPVHPQVAVERDPFGEVDEQVLAERLRFLERRTAASSAARGEAASADSARRRARAAPPSAAFSRPATRWIVSPSGIGLIGCSAASSSGRDQPARLAREAGGDDRVLEAGAEHRLAVDALDPELRDHLVARRLGEL